MALKPFTRAKPTDAIIAKLNRPDDPVHEVFGPKRTVTLIFCGETTSCRHGSRQTAISRHSIMVSLHGGEKMFSRSLAAMGIAALLAAAPELLRLLPGAVDECVDRLHRQCAQTRLCA